ncbi:hypothetical protein PR202_ga06003 [Eleusine coracana subsp. coracana]|uniref:Uncharacterized protein n=1 Tax=Eleusine coracana subsp. coracana TaxID=191504 RepID=A0AAV5BW54_ELECO|nr:hypothetical protein PR202_ga06003 [Eleusine coracana subsp. coracana]
MDDDRAGGAQPKPEPESAVRKGPWTLEEDLVLINGVNAHGEGAWNNLARAAGLKRTGKSCRLRWLNYLSPNVRRGCITAAEHEVILQLHAVWGNKWSKIARHLPGRTDNEVKNYWRTRIQRKQRSKNQDFSWEDSGSMAPTETILTAAAGGYLNALAITEDQEGSSNPGIVVPEANMCRRLDHPEEGYQVAGGGSSAGAMDVPPASGFLASMSGESFWALEDFWPTVQSFQSNSSLDPGRSI